MRMLSTRCTPVMCLAAGLGAGIVLGAALVTGTAAQRPTVPVGVIPGAPAGSPEQAPDSSGFDYTSLFHEVLADDTQGFTRIFNGTSLAGWDGDPAFWRVEGGSIVGESTPERRVERNTFLIWRGERLRDFELKVDFRLHGTNSGIQVRSSEHPDIGRWVLRGYQADLDHANGFTGNIHEEDGRHLLVPRGQIIRAVSGPAFKSLGRIADPTDLRGVVNVGNWNRYHIIARGPLMLQLVNGQLMAILLDEDASRRAMEGVLGLQMHVGDPFKVEYRNIWYKRL